MTTTATKRNKQTKNTQNSIQLSLKALFPLNPSQRISQFKKNPKSLHTINEL